MIAEGAGEDQLVTGICEHRKKRIRISDAAESRDARGADAVSPWRGFVVAECPETLPAHVRIKYRYLRVHLVEICSQGVTDAGVGSSNDDAIGAGQLLLRLAQCSRRKHLVIAPGVPA